MIAKECVRISEQALIIALTSRLWTIQQAAGQAGMSGAWQEGAEWVVKQMRAKTEELEKESKART